MRSRGALTLAAVLLPLGLLSACSGDDEPADDAGAKATPSGRPETEQKILRCRVTAEVTGAETATGIVGKGRVVVGGGGGPDAFYEYQDSGLTIAAYSEGQDFSPSVSVTVDGASYSTLQNTEGLDISPDGTQASVDAEATGVDPDSEGVRVVADFTCP